MCLEEILETDVKVSIVRAATCVKRVSVLSEINKRSFGKKPNNLRTRCYFKWGLHVSTKITTSQELAYSHAI